MSREEREESREPEGRKARVPLGTPKQRLAAPVRAGFKRRWVNDVPGRVQHAIDGGYTHVRVKAPDESDADRTINRKEVVGTKQDGSALTAYLMEIPEKFYKEDQKTKMAEIDKVDETIQRGNIRGADPEDTKRYYVPSEGISVKTD